MAHEPICSVSSSSGVSGLDLTHCNTPHEVFILVFHSHYPSPPSPSPTQATVPSISAPPIVERLDSLGPVPNRELRMLRMFHEVGQAFQQGADSLREVAKLLETRDLEKTRPDSVPCTLASISRECAYAKKSFGKRFQLPGDAPLFVSRGRGYSISGMSDLGMRAWNMTREFLIRQNIITPQN